jgi:UDP-glucose 4-epimerase
MGIALVTGAYWFSGSPCREIPSEQGYQVNGNGYGKWMHSEFKKWGLSAFLSSDVSYEDLLAYGCRLDLLVHCAGSGYVGL